MSLIAMLEKLAQNPLINPDIIENIGKSSTVIKKQIIAELANNNIEVSSDKFACELSIFSISK